MFHVNVPVPLRLSIKLASSGSPLTLSIGVVPSGSLAVTVMESVDPSLTFLSPIGASSGAAA